MKQTIVVVVGVVDEVKAMVGVMVEMMGEVVTEMVMDCFEQSVGSVGVG